MSKRLLITGGSGFLGRNLARALHGEYEIVLGARNNKLNRQVQEETGCRAVPLDVARIDSVRDVFTEFRPDVVIHAAATKFVDLSEQEPMECIDVNVLGSQNVARAAVENSIETVIGISTDKAAPPVGNTYALSKAIMERLFMSMDAKTAPTFVCVRFGNLAWSTGSVFPQWAAMQEADGVIKTTGPDMFRFFITVDEAVEIVTTALKHADVLAGKTLTRQMKAARIGDLLEVWTDTRGGTWELAERRPGDRDHEQLIGDAEASHSAEVTLDGNQYFAISPDRLDAGGLTTGISSATAEQLDRAGMLRLLDAAGD